MDEQNQQPDIALRLPNSNAVGDRWKGARFWQFVRSEVFSYLLTSGQCSDCVKLRTESSWKKNEQATQKQHPSPGRNAARETIVMTKIQEIQKLQIGKTNIVDCVQRHRPAEAAQISFRSPSSSHYNLVLRIQLAKSLEVYRSVIESRTEQKNER